MGELAVILFAATPEEGVYRESVTTPSAARGRMKSMVRGWSIAARLFAMQVIFIALLTAIATVWLSTDARTDVERDAAARSMVVATSIAANPLVVDAVESADPSEVLEPYALDLMATTATDFITIMAPDRTRFTHPDPSEIGKPFRGTIAPALRGESFTETYTGTLGPSVRAVVPIEDAGGDVVALVAAGVTVDNISSAFGSRQSIVFVAALVTLALGAVASWLLSRYLRRVTWGRGAEEMSRMFAYYEGVLHSVREGLVLVDDRGRLTLYNDQAAELLGLPFERPARPEPVSGLDLPEPLGSVLASGRRAVDELFVTASHVLVVNQEPAISAVGAGAARVLGTVTTLRDHTDFQALTGELQTMRTLSDALRSQTHEFANRLHTIVALIELDRPREALELAAHEIDLGQDLADRLVSTIGEPVLIALLLGKSAQARERDIRLELTAVDDVGAAGIPSRELVTIVGNLVDNAMDAVSPELARDGVRERQGVVSVDIRRLDEEIEFTVADNGDGIPDVDQAFRHGFSTKQAGPAGRGLGLALVGQSVRRLGGTIEVHNDGGAIVVVRLPGSRVPAASAEAAL
ncbi:MAG: sensor histidine kinase [Microbacteriaceae bacterium]|nr:sensor histidine kinase [Microbacteriaceae bacterium]